MTTRFFRTTGLLAVALVLLAGCDSASTDVSGLAPTAGRRPINGPGTLVCAEATYSYTPDIGYPGYFFIVYGDGVVLSQNTSTTPRTAVVYSDGGEFTIGFRKYASGGTAEATTTVNAGSLSVAC